MMKAKVKSLRTGSDTFHAFPGRFWVCSRCREGRGWIEYQKRKQVDDTTGPATLNLNLLVRTEYVRTIAFVAFDKTTGTKIPDQKCLLEIERTESICQYKLRCNNLKAIRFANCNILWVTDHKVYKSWKKMKVPTKILQNLTPWMWKKHSSLQHTLAVLFQCKPGLLGSLLFLTWQTRAVSCISEFSDLVNECKWPKMLVPD